MAEKAGDENEDKQRKLGQKYKEEGNKQMTKKQYVEAVESYSKALACEPENHIYLSNRCAAYAKTGETEKALEDAQQCVKLAPKWPKACLRLSHSLFSVGQLDEAKNAVEQGLKIVDEAEKELKDSKESKIKVESELKELKTHRASLYAMLKEVEIKVKEKKNSDFFEKIRGTWHGTIPEELGGYDQELQFLSESDVLVKIMDRVAKSQLELDATKTPIQMNLAVEIDDPTSENNNQGSNEGPSANPIEMVEYICDVVDDELWLCSPDPRTPQQRPTRFEGVTFVKLQRGGIPELDAEVKKEISKLDFNEKVRRYIKEAIPIFPDGQRLMPQESDTTEVQAQISLKNVKFQAENYKITQRYGPTVESEVRDLLVGVKTTTDEETMGLVEKLREKMRTAQLLPPEEELKQFLERQKDFTGDLLPHEFKFEKKSSEKKTQDNDAKESKSLEVVENREGDTNGVGKIPLEKQRPGIEKEFAANYALMAGAALGAAIAVTTLFILTRSSSSNNSK